MTQALSPPNTPRPDAAVLDRERAFFDKHYADEADAGIAPLTDFDKLRYTDPPADTIFPREYYYHLLAPLKGKRVLEIAAGNGIDAAILTHNGAQLAAYDLSHNSIDMVNQRCRVNNTADRLRTQVTGDFQYAFPGETFDHIVGYAALHHLPDLASLSQQVYDRLNPGGCAVFAEPVLNSKLLGLARRCVPLGIDDMTDDERPMTDRDLADFASPFDRVQRRYFQVTSRVWRLWPNRWGLAVALHKLDHGLMKLPGMSRLATVCVTAMHRDR
ncbi:methyltransferase domain-containing protein [Phycisphaeraceae bacterium D3-23]